MSIDSHDKAFSSLSQDTNPHLTGTVENQTLTKNLIPHALVVSTRLKHPYAVKLSEQGSISA